MRFRLAPAPAQEAALLKHCSHARFVWNLAVEQQALRDFAQAMANFLAGTHRRPTRRKAGVHEGFRIVGQRGRQWAVRRLSRKVGQAWVPKVGWVRFRWARHVPGEAKSYELLSVPGIHAAGRDRLVTRLVEKAPGRVEKIGPAYTSQTCHACGHRAAESRESQAVFRCRACGHADHAEVNAAENIAAGRAVTARGALQPLGGAANREPQPVLSSA
jgi:ribosomal protein L37AE/L43A